MNSKNRCVEVKYKGTIHKSEYTVEKGVVSLTYGMITHTTLSRGPADEREARRLLLEILEGDNWEI